MYAVIKTGGKQYRVQPGDLLVVEKLEADVGASVAFDQVLMLGGADGEVTIGAPVVDEADVVAGHGGPAGARSTGAGPVREEDVADLGRPDAVEDLESRALAPALEDAPG